MEQENTTPTPPVKDCGHQAEDGTCAHPVNRTPECHTNACPLVDLQRRLDKMFEDVLP